MGKVYCPPNGFKPPNISSFIKKSNMKGYWDACEAYVKEIKRWAKNNGDKSPESGQEISFPVADGYARYVVFSIKPVRLIHVDIGDAYQERYAHRLTAADIRKEVKQQTSFKKMFSKTTEII